MADTEQHIFTFHVFKCVYVCVWKKMAGKDGTVSREESGGFICSERNWSFRLVKGNS